MSDAFSSDELLDTCSSNICSFSAAGLEIPSAMV